MNTQLTCIECPAGCKLSVAIENCKVVKVSGNKCPKGIPYAVSEIENPSRILTATLVAQGLSLKMAPVRSDRPIPKNKIFNALEVIHKTTISKPVIVGEVIIENIVGSGVNIVVTRDINRH